jgi:hypothetical protein
VKSIVFNPLSKITNLQLHLLVEKRELANCVERRKRQYENNYKVNQLTVYLITKSTG